MMALKALWRELVQSAYQWSPDDKLQINEGSLVVWPVYMRMPYRYCCGNGIW